MTGSGRWVVDTSHYTHLARAGHAELLARLAPEGIVLVPTHVDGEIEDGRELYDSIPAVSSVPWAELAVLTEAEESTLIKVKANMGGDRRQHLGECAVIACAKHRSGVAILDERAAVAQAELFQVPTHDTLWVVMHAYKEIFDREAAPVEQIVDDLLATGMRLPRTTGKGIVAWAWTKGLLP